MSLKSRLLVLLASPLLMTSACTLPNPGHGSAGSEATGPTTAPTTTPTTPTTQTVDPSDSETTNALPTTTDTDTDTGSTTVTFTTTDIDTDTDTSSTSDTDPDPADCWGSDPNAWTIFKVADEDLGVTPTSPRVSPDGLTLYYTAVLPNPPLRWIHRATRPSRGEPFVSGEAIDNWKDQEEGLDHPNMNTAEDELIFAHRIDGKPADLWRTIRKDALWQTPELIDGSPNTMAYSEDFATITEDGARMIVQRGDGPANALLDGTWTFYEVERPPNSEAGTEFGKPTKVTLAPITDMPGHVVLCPALSPDGHHLFFASTYPKILQEEENDEVLKIFYTSRAALDQPWDAPVQLTSLDDDDPEYAFENCPNSVTRDGCQLYFNRFQFNKPDDVAPDPYRMFEAQRTP